LKRSSLYCSFVFILLVLFMSAATADLASAANETGKDYADFSRVSGVFLLQTGGSEVVLDIKGEFLPAPEIVKEGTTQVILDWEKSYIPSLNWSKAYTYPLVNSVSMQQEGENLRMIISVNEEMAVTGIKGKAPSNQYRLTLKTTRAIAEKQLQEAPKIKKVAPVRSRDPFTSNETVNMDLRDVELRDVFRMFGDIVGMNIIADPSVPSAYVTMTLKGVPLSEAFGYIMKMYDVNYAIMGETIIIGKADSLGKTLGREKTHSYHVAYAEAKAVAGLLQGLAGVNDVVVDERLKTVYVTAREELFTKVEAVLEKVDHPGRQIMLRARIIEVNDTARDELESLLTAVYDRWWLNYSESGTGVGYTYNNTEGVFDPDNDRSTSPINVDLENVADGTLRMLDAGIRSLVSDNKGKVLADPSVITIDDGTASIKLVENYKYISERDDAGNPTYDEEEVGPQLEFTPKIGRNGVITVELSVQTGEVIGTYRGAQGEEFPQTSTREVDTTVRVRDGEPFVVGGLFKENQTEESSKFPVLGDIPLIGELFKNRNKSTTKNEVVMIVIPYILDVPEGPLERNTL